MAVNLLTKNVVTTYNQATDWMYVVVGSADGRIIPDDFFKARDGNRSVVFYGTLSAAVTAIASSQATLLVPATTTVSASLTIPSNITLQFTGAGMISVSAGQTLTINGPVDAPLRQIFTGSGSVRFGGNIEASYPQWFGAAMDGAADDTAEIQAAINAFDDGTIFRAVIVRLVGAGRITSTLSITTGGLILEGTGWGISLDTRKRGYLKWDGAAGSPMILFQDCVQVGVKNIRLIGKSTAKPTAAVEFRQTGGGTTMDQPILENVYIGSYFSSDSDNAVQFDAGIKLSGNVNVDTGSFVRVHIQQCTIGVDNQNVNSSVCEWSTLQIGFCTTGFKTVAPHHVITNMLCAGNDVDIELAAQGAELTIYGFVSEGSGRMAVGSAVSPMRLTVFGGSFQAIDDANGGKFEDEDVSGKRWLMDFHGNPASAGLHIELRNFNLTSAGSPPTPVIMAWNTSDFTTPAGGTAVTLILDPVKGFTSSNFDVGSDNYLNSARIVVFNRIFANAQGISQFNRYIHDGNDVEDRSYQDSRFDIAGRSQIFGGPLKVKKLATPTGLGAVPTGSGATTYSYKVSALSHDGETLASTAATCVNGTLGGAVINTLAWFHVQGARAYNIYGRSSGSELLLKTLTVADLGDQSPPMWVDDGSLTASGALPTANTTGNSYILGTHKVMNTDDGAGNSEFMSLSWGSNLAKLLVGKTGSGVVRNLKIDAGDVAFQIAGNDKWGIFGVDFMLYPATDNTLNFGSDSFRIKEGYFGTMVKSPKFNTTATVFWSSGTGSPEGVVTAGVGSLYTRTDGGANTTLYVKESGAGNTGWIAK